MKKVYAAATVLILDFAFLAMAAEPVPRPAGTADQQFQKLAQRYHQVLSQRPRKGTALDLLYRHYLDAGKLDELVAHYERRVREEPKDAGAQIILGLICERRGRFQQALEAFGRAAKLAPDDYYPDYAAAQLLVRLHQDEQAIAAFQRALGKKPERNDLIQTLKTLGRVHLHQGDRDSALEAWERLADTFPEDAIALQELAELLAQEELFDEAIRRYQQLARLAKGDLYRQLLAHIEIGEIQVRQGKLQTAIQTFGRCLDQVKPNSWLAADIRRRIEAIFVRADDRVGLVAYYRKRLKAHPDDLESMVRLAAALAQLGQTDAALEQYRSAIKVAPSRADLREKLIDELTRQKDYPAAIDEAQRLVKREPSNVDYLERLGRLYLDSGQPDPATAADQALQVWKRIAEVRPEDPLAAVRVAELCREAAGIGSRSTGNATSNLYQSQSQTPLGEAALKYYAEAVSRAPDLPRYREYYGEYLFTIGRDDEAVAAWRQIAEAPRDTVENLKRVAQILSNVDRLPEAVQTAQQAIQKDPDRYDLHKLAADLLTQQEQYDAALKQVAEMERLADAPFLLEQTLQQRVAIYRAADRVAEEMAKLDQALRSGTASVRDAWLAAMLASAERRPAEALAHINQALKKKPDDALLLQFKAEIHQQGGDLAGAAEQYRRLAQIDPKQRTRHLTQVVNLELELGRLEAAVKTAEQIVRLTPGNAETAQLLANVYFRSGQDSNGLDVLRAALQANPRDREMRLLLARRLTERRQIDEAIEHLWRAFELSEARDDKLAVVAELAQQYGIAGRTEELIARLEQLRRSQEDPVGTTLYLVEAYTQSEDYVSARRELNALLARRPADAQVLGQLVSLSERLGDTEAALRYQQKLVALSRTPQMLDRLARLYEKAGDPDRAQAIWLEMVHKTKDETAVLLAVDRAMINAQYGQVFAMAEPRWAERPDDWRFGCRLTMAYWYAKRRETACRVARAILALPPSSKYQKDAAAKRQTRAVSVLQSYSPILMRVVWPMQLRASLASSRPLRFGRSGWQPRSLLDAQLLAAMILYESARLENKDQQYVEELRRRASSDLQALRQLVWIHLSERKLEGLEPLLEQWIAQSPEDPEPRLVRFMVPFVSAGGPAGLGDKVQHLATMKTTYEWLVAHRPALARAVSVPYVHALASAGRKDEAASLARKAILNAKNVFELMPISSVVASLNDSELLALVLARVEEFHRSGGASRLSVSLEALMRRYVEVTLRERDWDKLLASFDRYMTATQPKRISPIPQTTTAVSRASPSVIALPAGAVPLPGGLPRRPDRVGPFPCPSAWLDRNRLRMLEAVHKVLLRAGQRDRFIRLLDQRVAQTDGVARQCWTLARIFVDWFEDERGRAVQGLQQFSAQTPGNIEIRMLLARACAQMGDAAKALAALEGVSVPFGPAAKTLEQMRLELAQRAGNDDVGKRAALRLFGMRLTSSEQSALAAVMRRYGLVARSEALMKRAVRTAGSKPGELYQLMLRTKRTDLQRAVEIARLILQQTSRAPRSGGQSDRYRLEALRVLKRAGQLRPLIDKAEKQLAAAPRSAKLIEDLIEYYTADGNEQKAMTMTDRLLALRPEDARLHFRVAQSLFRSQKYAQGVARLEIVWKKDPQLVLGASHEIGRCYVQAKKLDRLAEHVKVLKGNPILVQQSYQLTNLVRNVQFNANDIDGVSKVYQAVIEVLPAEHRVRMIHEFARYLLRKKRKSQAYVLLRDGLLSVPNERDETAALRYQTLGSAYQADGVVVTALGRLANLAHELAKTDELKRQLSELARERPKGKPLCELLAAMLERRAGNERPLEEIGRRYLENQQFARSLAPYHNSLREELASCATESALRVALEVWTKPSPRVPGVVVYLAPSSTAVRVAAIHMKLKQREQARQALLKGLDVKFPVSMSPQSAAEQTIQRQLPIANALREYGFLLEAIDVYQRILRQMPDVRRNSYTRRYQGRQASQAIQQCVAQLIGPQRDATLNALLAELKRESPDLERFFAVCDPSLPDSSGSYRPSRATSPDANTLATAQAQLLPALLQHAHKSGKLTTIQKVLAERIQKSSSKPHQTPESAADQNTGVAAGPTRLRLDALRILAICSGETPDQAVPSLQDWLDRVEKKKQLAERPETWLLALAALDRPATRTLGQRLAAAVFRSAARTGNSSRQQAALAALARSGAETDALVQQIMVDRKGDPEALYQVAQAYYQQRKYAKAVEALKPVWQRAPELLMPRLRYLADYYVKADRLKDLADAIRSVRDTNLLGRYAYELGNLIAKLPRDPEHARSVIELYFAWGEAADGAASTYQASRLASYLSRLPRDENTLGLYRLVVFPSKRHGGSLENFAGQMVELAQATGRLQALRRDCRRGMDAFPQWKAKGELLLAMLELRLGDEEPMNQIARKYKTDPAFAAQLASEVTLLRGELAQCEGRPAAELALELWQPLMANEEGGATSATVQVAKLLGKLGQRDKARQVLLNRLRKPFAVTFTAEEDYLTRLKLREKQDLGQELARQGFPIDALRAYASALASDTSRIATDSFTRQTVNQMREAARQLIQQTASKDVDSLLTQLQLALDERNPGKAMTPFFIVIDHVPDVVSPPTSSPIAPDAILPLLLEHAKRKGKLAELKLQVAEARKTRGQDHRLIALDVLIRLAEGDTVAALAELERLDQRARESRRSIDDALWLATREALKADATNRTARALAERVAEAAGRANNLIRQEAAAVALANARAAGDQGEGVSELMRALIVGKSRDPETQLQLARVLFRQNRGVEAADTLAPIWKRHPGVLLKSIEELARLYAQTGQTDRLSEALKSVTDDEARRRYRYDVTNAAIALANDKQYADEAITILRAAVRFTPAENREYPLNHLANLLIQQGRKAEAWQTYCATVIPPQGPADRLPDSAISLASLTVKIGKFDELTRLCQRAVKTHPQWQNCAELLVAMARFQKNKDEMALQEIARRFQTDPNYAQSLRASASVLRSQFAVLSGKPALEVAAELWQTELDRTKARGPTGRTVQYSFYSYGSFADVLIKMGHREKARNVLLDALASDTTGHASAFRDFYLLQRNTYLAPRLLKADYPLDALRLLQQDVKLEGSPLAREPRVANQIARRQRILRSAVLQTLTGDLDTALQALQKTLEEPEPAELATFFAVAAPKWTTQEIERIPKHVRLEPASQTQLLPALLRHAREKGRLDELAEMAASARKSGPNNERLTALTVFIQDARGGQDALGALIALSRNDDKDLRQLAIACLMRYRSPTAAQAIEAARQASP